MQILLLDQGICREFVKKWLFFIWKGIIVKGICGSGGWFAADPGGNSKAPDPSLGLGRGTGAAVFIPSWKLGWDGLALIQTRSLAWFEGGNIPTFQIKYDTNIYSQTYKNRSTFKTRQGDAQCDLESALWEMWNEANSAEETRKILELAVASPCWS